MQGKLAAATMTVPYKEAVPACLSICNQRFSINEVSTAVLLRNRVLWDVTLCPWLMLPDISQI
jgi:hypothetical protein